MVRVAAGRRRLRRRRLPRHRPAVRHARRGRGADRRGARRSGIRTIIDIVPNHVSDQHPWFVEALDGGPGLAERDRFWFRPGRGRRRRASRRTTGARTSATRRGPAPRTPTGRPATGTCTCSRRRSPTSTGTTPPCGPSTRTILRFWFDRGVGGVRIDSAALAIKDPTCPSSPTRSPPAAAPVRRPRRDARRLPRLAARSPTSYDPPRVLIGEVWLEDRDRFARYLRPDELHGAFNFDFLAAPWDADALRALHRRHPRHATRRSAPPRSGCCPTTTSPAPVTRYGREDTSFSFAAKRIGTPTDLALGDPPGPRRGRCSPPPCPARSTCTRATSSACPRSRTCPPTASRTRCTSSRAASTPAATAAGCRCRGRATTPPFGFSPPFATDEPWLPQPASWAALTVERRGCRSGVDALALPHDDRPAPRAPRRRRTADVAAERRRTC